METGQLNVNLFNAKVRRYNCAKFAVNWSRSPEVMAILVFQYNASCPHCTFWPFCQSYCLLF